MFAVGKIDWSVATHCSLLSWRYLLSSCSTPAAVPASFVMSGSERSFLLLLLD